MVKNRFDKGKKYEQKIVRQLKSEGYIAARSAASKSPIDVWAVHPQARIIRLIQAKKGRNVVTGKQKKEIKDLCESLTGPYNVIAELWEED